MPPAAFCSVGDFWSYCGAMGKFWRLYGGKVPGDVRDCHATFLMLLRSHLLPHCPGGQQEHLLMDLLSALAGGARRVSAHPGKKKVLFSTAGPEVYELAIDPSNSLRPCKARSRKRKTTINWDNKKAHKSGSRYNDLAKGDEDGTACASVDVAPPVDGAQTRLDKVRTNLVGLFDSAVHYVEVPTPKKTKGDSGHSGTTLSSRGSKTLKLDELVPAALSTPISPYNVTDIQVMREIGCSMHQLGTAQPLCHHSALPQLGGCPLDSMD